MALSIESKMWKIDVHSNSANNEVIKRKLRVPEQCKYEDIKLIIRVSLHANGPSLTLTHIPVIPSAIFIQCRTASDRQTKVT